MKSFLRFLLICLLPSMSLLAGTGQVTEGQLKAHKTVIYAESYEVEARIYGKVIKQDDGLSPVSAKEAAELPYKLMQEFFDSRFGPKYEMALYQKGKEPTKEELTEAQNKDAAYIKKLTADVEAAYKRVGLIYDPEKEVVVHFFAGKAQMKVLECLKGELKAGDVIEVSWKNIKRRVSCPPWIPFQGKFGWMFSEALTKGSKAQLGHGFVSLKKAKEIVAKVEAETAQGNDGEE